MLDPGGEESRGAESVILLFEMKGWGIPRGRECDTVVRNEGWGAESVILLFEMKGWGIPRGRECDTVGRNERLGNPEGPKV